MALQTLTATTANAAPTNTVASDPDGDDLNTRNSVPFSFLVAFLALFVCFMGLGLWARRIVFFARRRLGLPVPELPQRRQRIRPRKPVLWDMYPDGCVQPEKWEGMEPLSSWFCREVPVVEVPYEDPELTQPWPPQSPMHQRMPRRGGVPVMDIAPTPSPSGSPRLPRDRMHPIQNLKEWWLDLVDPMRHSPPKDGLGDKGQVDQLQVAVLISMPSLDRGIPPATNNGGVEQLGELSIGIVGMPWNHDDSALDLPETRT
ncbi:uncharacterized protein PHACADRAFT_251287 [Phanerochaete carnosa HHB-10118-sp]|uniref:Uncharacterized protein n=1 Tax=Phanerochaete carnosa (strain HHB-10118-sp) TaxID=650164 RepID=K5V4N7_PHACS|nr:uncharacterized protein PHACADRAFT_251287 [Phanerochaete carnosa HHB-10118-sp]EKM57591.1 hypothetical protein PHACADRAFT_251287 [Phanerochaete carnosa HHB-10118-sp]